jgi:hypothetical protein
VAFVFADAHHDEQFERALQAEPEVLAAYASLGSSSAVLLLASPSEGELTLYASTRLPCLPGVISSQVAYASEVLHHRSHLVKTVGPRTSSK